MIFDRKEDIDLEDLKELQPATFVLFTHAVLFCQEHNLALKITSLKSDRKNVQSVSTTHSTGRAIDISVNGWPKTLIHKFVFDTNRMYREIAAISHSDGKPRAAIYHNYKGQGEHIHLQVRENARIPRFYSGR